MEQEKKDIKSIVEKKWLWEPLNGLTVFVTGATGLIGSMLVKVICSASCYYGYNINVIGHVRNRKKAEEILGNLINSIKLVDSFDVDCNFIIHTISPTASSFFINNPVETIRSSVERTVDILEIAKETRASLVYLSSMEQYGVPYKSGQIMTEEQIGVIDHLNIRSSYSESKRLCECLCASYASEYGVDVKIARLAQTFGAGVPKSDNRMPVQFAKAAVNGQNIVLHTEGKSVSNFVYLSDAITGILTILEKGTPGNAYNICNDKETRMVRDIAELVAEEICNGRIGVEINIPQNNMGYAPDVDMYLDSTKIRSLGWVPEVNMVEAYRRLVQYLIEQ